MEGGQRTDPRCARDFPASQDELPIASLRAPDGAVAWNGGSGGGGDSWQASTRLQTALSAAQLMDHYAAQLRQAGWTTQAPARDGSVLSLSAERSGRKGRPWRALLAVTELDAPSQYDLIIRFVGGDAP